MNRMLVSVLVAGLVGACTNRKATPTSCTQTATCEAGSVCLDGVCTPLPTITSVRGNSTTPTAIADGIVVAGTGFADATFTLGALALTVRSHTATEAELVLPANVVSGEYVLTVVNQAGSDETAVTLTLPELGGNVLVERINQATNRIDATRVDIGYDDLGALPAHTHSALDMYSAACTVPGALGFDAATNRLRMCSGSAWQYLTPVSGPILDLVASDYAGGASWVDRARGTTFTATNLVADSSGAFVSFTSAASTLISNDSIALPASGYTFEAVVRVADYDANFCGLVHGNDPSYGNSLNLCLRNANRIELDEFQRNLVGNNVLVDGSKHHLAFVHENNNEFSMYIDGVLDRRGIPAAPGAYGNGQGRTGTMRFYWFNALTSLYAARLYDRALAPNEIMADYLAAP